MHPKHTGTYPVGLLPPSSQWSNHYELIRNFPVSLLTQWLKEAWCG